MRRNKNNLAILRMLISLAMLTPVCSMVASSPQPGQAPVGMDTAITSYNPDAATTLLTQAATTKQRVSFSLRDDLSSSSELLKRSLSTGRISSGPAINVWYGEYFTAHNLRVLGASPIEREPSRLGLRISFTF